MHVPTDGWKNGAWNSKLSQFRLLGEMVGLGPAPSPEDLQGAFSRVASAKVFMNSVAEFMAATGKPEAEVLNDLKKINHQLGLMESLPFMSLRGLSDPSDFRGVAIWPAGTVAWMQLRWDQIKQAEQAGATFERIIVLGSSRLCNAAADRRHPYIRGAFAEGREPTERELMKQWVLASGKNDTQYAFPELDDVNEQGRPLSLEQQLKQLVETGQCAEFVGDRSVYVPANPNALYVPLHVRRVLGLDNVWFSQAGARLCKNMPAYWWPSLQDLMTTPSGIFRLWIELVANGCMK